MMMIILMPMPMLMLSSIAFSNAASKESYEELHPKQSAWAIAQHGRQAVQHYQFFRRLYNTASVVQGSIVQAVQRYKSCAVLFSLGSPQSILVVKHSCRPCERQAVQHCCMRDLAKPS